MKKAICTLLALMLVFRVCAPAVFAEYGALSITKDPLGETVKDIELEGVGTDTLKIRNIPLRMNGWRVLCRVEQHGDDRTKKINSNQANGTCGVAD